MDVDASPWTTRAQKCRVETASQGPSTTSVKQAPEAPPSAPKPTRKASIRQKRKRTAPELAEDPISVEETPGGPAPGAPALGGPEAGVPAVSGIGMAVPEAAGPEAGAPMEGDPEAGSLAVAGLPQFSINQASPPRPTRRARHDTTIAKGAVSVIYLYVLR